MLYWIFLFILVLCIIGTIIGIFGYKNWHDVLFVVSAVGLIISAIIVIIMTIFVIDANTAIDAKISSNQQRYEALVCKRLCAEEFQNLGVGNAFVTVAF